MRLIHHAPTHHYANNPKSNASLCFSRQAPYAGYFLELTLFMRARWGIFMSGKRRYSSFPVMCVRSMERFHTLRLDTDDKKCLLKVSINLA